LTKDGDPECAFVVLILIWLTTTNRAAKVSAAGPSAVVATMNGDQRRNE
jgi:hypothetical protein